MISLCPMAYAEEHDRGVLARPCLRRRTIDGCPG
ncbi:hypothetical protein C8D81_0862 [Enemella evansiae]|nr:hypothetical protein C8D81_0862 [Enemella evansiae]